MHSNTQTVAAKAGKVYLGENICAQALVGKRFSTLGLGMPLQKGARITTTAEVPSSPLHPGHIPYHCRSGTITTFIATAEVVSSPLSLPLQKWNCHCRSGTITIFITTAEVGSSPLSLPLQKWHHITTAEVAVHHGHFHYHCRSGIITTAEVAFHHGHVHCHCRSGFIIFSQHSATAEVVHHCMHKPQQKMYRQMILQALLAHS